MCSVFVNLPFYCLYLSTAKIFLLAWLDQSYIKKTQNYGMCCVTNRQTVFFFHFMEAVYDSLIH